MSGLRVAVLHGGRSGEHEVSLRSAESVIDALARKGHRPIPYFISKDGRWHPAPIIPVPGSNPDIDVVFPVLHGTFGEDGTVQGLLEMAALPYVGAGVFASAAAMDKDLFKRICRERGLPVADYLVLHAPGFDPAPVLRRLPFPVFVKPANLGSSVGIHKAHNAAELAAALADAARYDTKILVERCITGPELECAVIGNHSPEASTPCQIFPSREFYDYDDKYILDKARAAIPAEVPAEIIRQVRRLAVECYRAVGCAGMGRVDFLVEAATGQVFINELNTIPGFTSISMFPKMWAYDGLPMPELVHRLVELALERFRERQALRYEK
jgi:D-alanine-D-alanine ligase